MVRLGSHPIRTRGVLTGRPHHGPHHLEGSGHHKVEGSSLVSVRLSMYWLRKRSVLTMCRRRRLSGRICESTRTTRREAELDPVSRTPDL